MYRITWFYKLFPSPVFYLTMLKWVTISFSFPSVVWKSTFFIETGFKTNKSCPKAIIQGYFWFFLIWADLNWWSSWNLLHKPDCRYKEAGLILFYWSFFFFLLRYVNFSHTCDKSMLHLITGMEKPKHMQIQPKIFQDSIE